MIGRKLQRRDLESSLNGTKIRHDDLPVANNAIEKQLTGALIRGGILEDARTSDTSRFNAQRLPAIRATGPLIPRG